jgi:catechol 2,3-dioxygenase-like lactoylglutathione lyase family enzyme
MSRLLQKYKEEALPALQEKFGYKNVMAVPRLEKIIINMGVGKATDNNYKTIGGLNHIAVVVDDIDAMEARVRDAGFTPGSHADYEPGRRFYFDDHDGIEYEVVSYD